MTTPQGKALDVFVHHSDVSWQGDHRISPGAPLEFKLARNRDSGRFKATRVTAPDGQPVAASDGQPVAVTSKPEWKEEFDRLFGI